MYEAPKSFKCLGRPLYVLVRLWDRKLIGQSIIFDQLIYFHLQCKMPKICVNKAQLCAKEFLNKFQMNPNGNLFCVLRCQTVNCAKRFRIDSHQCSAKHTKQLSANTDNKPQPSRHSFQSIRGILMASWLKLSVWWMSLCIICKTWRSRQHEAGNVSPAIYVKLQWIIIF